METITHPYAAVHEEERVRRLEKGRESDEMNRQTKELKHSLSFTLLLDMLLLDAMFTNKTARQRQKLAGEAKALWDNYGSRIAQVRKTGSSISILANRPAFN